MFPETKTPRVNPNAQLKIYTMIDYRCKKTKHNTRAN